MAFISLFWGDILFKKNKKVNIPLQKQDIPSLVWATLAVILVLGMVIQPKVVYEGSVNGLKAWLNIVFPSLLPFFIVSEILMKLGFVRFLGVLLEPVMRPLFNVPGAGAFVMVIGFTSGFPIASTVTAQLRQQGLCTRVEAERLMCFTNNSSPLFMLTAVAVGMFGRADLGLVIAGSHYLANILLGFALRFYKYRDRETTPQLATSWSIKQAFKALLRQPQGRQPLGRLIGEAVTSSISKLLNIGGFIILFAVIIRLLNYVGVINLLATILGYFLIPLGLHQEVLSSLASGIFEMTIGTKLASEASAPELQRIITVAMILGWSGLSIHAQVASMIAKTDIRMGLFIVTRVAHAALAAFCTVLFYRPENINTNLTLPTLGPAVSLSSFTVVSASFIFMILSFIFLIVLGFFARTLLKISKLFSH